MVCIKHSSHVHMCKQDRCSHSTTVVLIRKQAFQPQVSHRIMGAFGVNEEFDCRQATRTSKCCDRPMQLCGLRNHMHVLYKPRLTTPARRRSGQGTLFGCILSLLAAYSRAKQATRKCCMRKCLQTTSGSSASCIDTICSSMGKGLP